MRSRISSAFWREVPAAPVREARPLSGCSTLAPGSRWRTLHEEPATLSANRVMAELGPFLSAASIEHALVRPPTDPRALFCTTGTGAIRFKHRLITEYLAALLIRNDRTALAALADRGNATDAIGFALNLSQNPAESLVAVAERLGIDELERLGQYLATLPVGAMDRARTALVERLRIALGADRLLSGSPAQMVPVGLPADPEEVVPEGWPPDLEERWSVLQNSKAKGKERGDELEDFMADFFGVFFDVVERKYHAVRGEIDILLEIPPADPFWMDHGPDICVECKNKRREKADLPEIKDVLAARRHDRKLTFFVSSSGFTRYARDEIKSAAQNLGDPVIVPISGKQIAQTLADREEPAGFSGGSCVT